MNNRPKNKWERKIYDRLFNEGGIVYRNGHPDLMSNINGYIVAIEVKAIPSQILSIEQQDMMELLHSIGVICYKWNPQDKFVALFPNSPTMDEVFYGEGTVPYNKDNPIRDTEVKE